MLLIAFIGTIQHEVSKEAVRELVRQIKAESTTDCIIVCNADGLFLTSSKLNEQLETLFDSGIDLICVGEQAISRNCCRTVFKKAEWPIIKAINLPGSSFVTSAKLFEQNNERLNIISTSGQKGKISVDYSYTILDEYFRNKKDSSTVIIIESNSEYRYLQALAWRYSKFEYSVMVLGVGTGFATSPSLQFGDKTLFQYDLGSVVAENTIGGFDPELWWRKNIERRPLTLIPKWGALKCEYTIVCLNDS